MTRKETNLRFLACYYLNNQIHQRIESRNRVPNQGNHTKNLEKKSTRVKLWKRASVALKDGSSLFAADNILTTAVVKAMSNDELAIDTENALFIYRHVRASPSSLKPLISAISSRVERTRSWTVALKGLMLVHGFFLCKTTAAESIGRLPFDLSNFGEGNSWMCRSGGFNLFVRAYFAFLDRRSILFHDDNRHRYDEDSSVMIRLAIIRKMQIIVDSLIRIKPIGENMKIPLIYEAMENVINEILEIYGWICRRIAEVLPNIHSKNGKSEADQALKIVAKSMSQGEKLVKFFEFCRDFGIASAKEIPRFVLIPELEVSDLAHLVHRIPEENEDQQKPETTAETTTDTETEADADSSREEVERKTTTQESIPDMITQNQNEREITPNPTVEIPDLITL